MRTWWRRISPTRKLLVAGAISLALVGLHQSIPHQWLHNDLGAIAGGGDHAHASVPMSTPSLGHIEATNPINSGKSESDCPKHPPPFIDDSFPEPEMLHSINGRLATSLTLATVPTEINGSTYTTTDYNASFPGPTLLFCPGDTLRIYVRNHLNPADFANFDHAGQTSFHTHGMHVSPQKPQDNIYVKIPSASSYQHRYAVPTDHRPGAYWYHPHRHGQTNVQTYGGAAGAMISQGGLDDRPDYRDIGQRVIVIQQTTLDDTNHTTVKPGPQGPFVPAGAKFFVNGHLNPTIPIKPGEIQRWHVLNLTAGSFVDLQLQGQPLQLLSQDANYVPRILNEDHMLIAPASRREVLITGPPAGTTEPLVALPFAQFGGAPSAEQTLATLDSEGSADPTPAPSSNVHAYRDLRKAKVDQTHEVVYTQQPPNFFISNNGGPPVQFDPRRLDQVMTLEEVNKWTVTNDTTFWHTFHIHIQDFQVTKTCDADGCTRPDYIDDQDNVSVPPNGSVTFLTRPTQFTGRFVFHCHVLGHEDNGMMGTVRVVRRHSPLAG